jgi:hypothetical protein
MCINTKFGQNSTFMICRGSSLCIQTSIVLFVLLWICLCMTNRGVRARVAKPSTVVPFKQISHVMNNHLSFGFITVGGTLYWFQVRSPQDTSHTKLCAASNKFTLPHESYRQNENCAIIPEGKFISIVITRAPALMWQTLAWSDDAIGILRTVNDFYVT